MAFIHSRGPYINILIITLNYSIYIGCYKQSRMIGDRYVELVLRSNSVLSK
jgi:hypothetical protein